MKSMRRQPLADAIPCSPQARHLTRSPMDPRLVYLAALVYRLSRMPQMREGSPSTVAGAPSKSGGSSTTPRCSGVGVGAKKRGWVSRVGGGEGGWAGPDVADWESSGKVKLAAARAVARQQHCQRSSSAAAAAAAHPQLARCLSGAHLAAHHGLDDAVHVCDQVSQVQRAAHNVQLLARLCKGGRGSMEVRTDPAGDGWAL